VSAAEEDHPLRPVPRHRYVDFEIAGAGAMGLVYSAHDTELRRNVAFKIVRPDDTPASPLEASAPALDARFEELSARFLREAWVTGGMEHPGIVPVYELGRTEGGVPYYTMRFVPGQRTLATAIGELEAKPFEQRLTLLEPFLKLCDAVSYAHARGVIHRDLKPANVALGEFGEVVLLDWGLAKLLERGGAAPAGPAPAARPTVDFQTDGLGLGTPGYMPPEAVRGGVDDLDDRSDVYSLGVILYQILTGRCPHDVKPFPTYLDAVLHHDAPLASTVDPAVPGALDDLCARALARDRDDRLPGVRALAEGIRQWRSQTALEREMEGWLRDARSALAAAEDARGPARIRQTQRALAVLESARKQRPESARLRQLQSTAKELHNRGIRETQRSGRQRVVLVGGVSLLALLSIAAFSVAALVNEKRKEAERANRKTAAALADANTQREKADREASVAEAAKREAELEAAKARDSRDLVSALVRAMDTGDVGTGRLADVLEAGIEKAAAQGNADGVFLLLEQSLDQRPFARLAIGAAIRTLPVPADLAAAAEAARRRSGEAYRAYLPTREGRTLGEVRRAKRALDEAQREHAHALEDIVSALAREVEEPASPTLDEVQATLGSTDVFVSYARVRDFAVAVVIGRTSAQLVSLGEAARIEASLAALRDALREPQDASPAIERLRAVLVDRLALRADCRRVFVVPEEATTLVPFALLMPGREVSIVPSAAAYLYLRALKVPRGSGVLAVADARHAGVPRLLGARAEAEAVGTVTLLGEDATRANLEASLSSRERWRSVHLGLTGRLAAADPYEVHLEASPGIDEDSDIGIHELARLDLRADLVVLSTASLRRTLGDLGAHSLDVPQALLFAGARRVLFPVAFPDDEAARALMTRFYELWRPEEGEGLDAAAALKQAQDFVRGHEKWRHPYFWAPWVLWGLAE